MNKEQFELLRLKKIEEFTHLEKATYLQSKEVLEKLKEIKTELEYWRTVDFQTYINT